jgi:DNA (cytosine-5)-methyltransferase 1
VKYIDVCSGISAPTQAWKPLGWEALCFAEIEAAPRAVLMHHYPDTPLRGDFTEIEGNEYGPVDLLVGGTPCQSFSVAGLRGGLGDDRGNLALEFARLADRARPRWVVWENVPGVLSSNGGRDFGSILGALAELGYGTAYSVLDAQHFGVPQRRRRVFAVGYLGDWRRAAAVLFERHSLSGHPAPRREAGPGVAALTANGVGTCGADDNQGQAGHLIAFDRQSNCEYGAGEIASTIHARDYKSATDLVCDTLTSNGDAHSGYRAERGLVPVAFAHQGGGTQTSLGYDPESRICQTLGANQTPAVAFNMHKSGNEASSLGVSEDRTDCLRAFDKSPFAVMQHASAVRRLTPRECERLQGFPDDFTLVPHRNKPMADGPRYKMLGNSMAVPVLRWIGERIAMVDAMPEAGSLAA